VDEDEGDCEDPKVLEPDCLFYVAVASCHSIVVVIELPIWSIYGLGWIVVMACRFVSCVCAVLIRSSRMG
jgi:hypothetical protein